MIGTALSMLRLPLAQSTAEATEARNWGEMLHTPTAQILAGVVLAAVGVWLLLPRGTRRGRIAGCVLALLALAHFGMQAPRLSMGWIDSTFAAIALTTVVSCAATISSRNPLYSAIWFGMALLGTAGLFLLQGAQFLALATVVVYAGAILVTFLFALMLAQPGGHAFYDRISWEAGLSAAAGAILVGMLTVTLATALVTDQAASGPDDIAVASADDLATGVLADQHVARLGGQLFSRHLIAVEVAGALLLAALVGAMAIVQRSMRGGLPPGVGPTRPEPRGRGDV
jgi:NADH-quinone oxidoreductase subunit J